MGKQTLGFNDIVVNKKDFHASKKSIHLNSVNTNNMRVINILLLIMMV